MFATSRHVILPATFFRSVESQPITIFTRQTNAMKISFAKIKIKLRFNQYAKQYRIRRFAMNVESNINYMFFA